MKWILILFLVAVCGKAAIAMLFLIGMIAVIGNMFKETVRK